MVMQEQFSVQTEFKEIAWFFPNLKNTNKLQILLTTIAKLTIYQARNGNSQPTVKHFLNLLRIQAEKEYGVAIARNKVSEFHEKWGNAGNVLPTGR